MGVPLARRSTSTTDPTDFKGWVLSFYGAMSNELAKLPTMLADAQVARWQSKYGRDPTDQQRSWLVNKIRTDIAMRGGQAQRPGHHQEPSEHAREVPSAHGSAKEDGAGVSGLDPPVGKGTVQMTTHGRM
jgi:hypothetical protein